ncbi:MAG: sigma-70 family RNA polymerase sigma factor [Phycisphaerales bacterium]|nr:sigma-70 family RNA polymerase sigma factor [Phycisphaerales bacterium]
MPISQDMLVRVIVRDHDKLYTLCWAILRDDNLAEDVLQDICALAVQKREGIANEDHLTGWLRVAARRQALAALRSRSHEPILFDQALLDLLETSWRSWDQRVGDSLREALRYCLGKLDARGRDLMSMRYELGLKSRQIAEQLGCKVETVYMATLRTHAKLRDCVRAKLEAAEQ